MQPRGLKLRNSLASSADHTHRTEELTDGVKTRLKRVKEGARQSSIFALCARDRTRTLAGARNAPFPRISTIFTGSSSRHTKVLDTPLYRLLLKIILLHKTYFKNFRPGRGGSASPEPIPTSVAHAAIREVDFGAATRQPHPTLFKHTLSRGHLFAQMRLAARN